MDIGYVLSTFLLPAVLAFIMFGMGMTLTLKDFKNIVLFPKIVIIGLVLQMIALPLFAFLIASLSNMPAPVKVGFVLIAACPGGSIANLLNHLFKANLALSVTLTAFNSFLVVFSLPLIVNIGLNFFMDDSKVIDLPFWKTFMEVLQITVLPCALGLLVRHYFTQLAIKLEKPLNFIMPILLGITMLATIYFKQSNVKVGIQDYVNILPYALILNIGGMCLGFFLPLLFGIKKRNRLTISIEVGLQNTGLAITVATSGALLNNAQMAIPAVVYALFTFVTAVAWGVLMNRRRYLRNYRASQASKR